MKFIERDEDYILGLYLAAYHTNTHTCLVRGAWGGGGVLVWWHRSRVFQLLEQSGASFFLGGGGGSSIRRSSSFLPPISRAGWEATRGAADVEFTLKLSWLSLLVLTRLVQWAGAGTRRLATFYSRRLSEQVVLLRDMPVCLWAEAAPSLPFPPPFSVTHTNHAPLQSITTVPSSVLLQPRPPIVLSSTHPLHQSSPSPPRPTFARHFRGCRSISFLFFFFVARRHQGSANGSGGARSPPPPLFHLCVFFFHTTASK